MKKKLFGTKRRATITSILAVAVLTTTAFAAWSVLTSSGSGSAGVGQLVAPTITNVASPLADAFPNSASLSGSLSLTVDNPNPGTLYLKSFGVRRDGVTGGNGSCDWSPVGTTTAPGFKYLYLRVGTGSSFYGGTGSGAGAPPLQPLVNVTGLSISVPSGISTVTVPNMVGLADETPSGCQGTVISGIELTNATFSTSDS